MLKGKHVVLREWRESDLSALATMRNDIALQRLLMTQAKPNSIERVRLWLTERSHQENMVFFVIADRKDVAVGYLQVADIDRFHGRGDFGICLLPEAHGRGIATEACQLLEEYLRSTLAMHKLCLQVLVDNEHAISFYRKCGYCDVGILHQHFRDGNSYRDVLLMERMLTP